MVDASLSGHVCILGYPNPLLGVTCQMQALGLGVALLIVVVVVGSLVWISGEGTHDWLDGRPIYVSYSLLYMYGL